MRICGWLLVSVCLLTGEWNGAAAAAATRESSNPAAFPSTSAAYEDAHLSLWGQLRSRATREPLNAIASVLFLVAILHTFMAPKILHLAHHWRTEHRELLRERRNGRQVDEDEIEEVSFRAEVAHFFGEVEAIFGIWVVPLLLAIVLMKDWRTAEHYISHTVQFTEPLFVVVIMAIAASRPVLFAAEFLMQQVARLGGSTPAAFWLSILTIGPLLGSFITEPAAMTISALLLSRLFEYPISNRFRYATLGLLFVNVSIGGTLTHFAAPPVLMVAGTWGWGTMHMLTYFGWKAMVAIAASNALYFFWFRSELAALNREAPPASATQDPKREPVPIWVICVHLIFLGWTVFTAHHPAFFIGAFLFFLAFTTATEHHQDPVVLRPALLVGFFLAGLVIHGGLQGWWLTPVLQSLTEVPLFLGAMALTAFNDNAAITYLASLVPTLTPEMKYAVVAGAVTGGGLTVIANAPNPAGQSILSKHFPDGISPMGLLLGALAPTLLAAVTFLLFR